VTIAQPGTPQPGITQHSTSRSPKVPRTEKECSDEAKTENLSGEAARKSVQAYFHPVD
jgi:hypothetical protein